MTEQSQLKTSEQAVFMLKKKDISEAIWKGGVIRTETGPLPPLG